MIGGHIGKPIGGVSATAVALQLLADVASFVLTGQAYKAITRLRSGTTFTFIGNATTRGITMAVGVASFVLTGVVAFFALVVKYPVRRAEAALYVVRSAASALSETRVGRGVLQTTRSLASRLYK